MCFKIIYAFTQFKVRTEFLFNKTTPAIGQGLFCYYNIVDVISNVI